MTDWLNDSIRPIKTVVSYPNMVPFYYNLNQGVGNLKTNSGFSYTALRGAIARDTMTWQFHVLFLHSISRGWLSRNCGFKIRSSKQLHSTWFGQTNNTNNT